MAMRSDKENVIVQKTFQFALQVIQYTEGLRALRKFDMASQLFRSGTSIGANVMEAQNAESKIDFIHKFKIACKEADETIYWLRLCKESIQYPDPDPQLLKDFLEINRIISKIISTTKRGGREPISGPSSTDFQIT